MTKRISVCGVGAAGVLLLGGCAATADTATHGHSMPGMEMSPGMSMSDMAAHSSGHHPVPSASARMICSGDTHRSVATTLHLDIRPSSHDRWSHGRYTCSYHTTAGMMVLSVEDSPDPQSGRGYFDRLRHRLGEPALLDGMTGLGLPAFETGAGQVAFLKDGKTLEVDASALTGDLGGPGQTRSDVAYQVATDVIGCWSG
ncbi:MAG: hypothetical protein ACRDPB_03630 [Nocardioidaceae bacterium]